MKHIKSHLALFVLVFTVASFSSAQSVDYKLSMPDPHTHYFEVEMTVSNLKAKSFDVKMPVWAPGSYLIREFAKSVEDVSASSNDKELVVQKVNKNTWRIKSNKAGKVSVKYRVYAFELSVRTSYVDASHGYVNGTSVFMYLDGHLDASGALTINPYKDWSEISTGLPVLENDKWTRSYSHYDILVDSPIEIGNQYIFSFKAAGLTHHVAMYGEGNYDEKVLMVDMAKVIESATDIFGFNPNKEYTFIIHNLSKGSGGLEHLNSTTLQVDRWTYTGKKYLGFLSLVAHEYFHLWNVKRIRPIELGPFDYDKENYTSLLWIMEGFTSYYDELLLVHSGFYTPDQYLNKLVGTITRVENQPGNKVLPLSESSLDAWIKLYRPNENSYNTTISYYSKGSLVAAMLDLEIMNATDGEKSLSDVMKALYSKYYEKQKRGFTEAEAISTIEEVAGKQLDEFLANYVNGTETIPYNQYLGYANLIIEDANAELNKPSLGVLTTGSSESQVKISSVTRNTTAYTGGLSVKDEILAINGIRASKSNLKALIEMNKVGSTIEVLINRDGLLLTLSMELSPDPSKNYRLKLKDEGINKVGKAWMY